MTESFFYELFRHAKIRMIRGLERMRSKSRSVTCEKPSLRRTQIPCILLYTDSRPDNMSESQKAGPQAEHRLHLHTSLIPPSQRRMLPSSINSFSPYYSKFHIKDGDHI